MATLKLLLREDKIKQDGTAPVYLRITAHRRSKYVKTDVAVPPRLWDAENQKVSRSHPQHVFLNQELEDVLLEAAKARSTLRQRGKLSAESIRRELKDEASGTVYSFMEEYADEWKRKGKYWEHQKVHVLMNKLKGYSNRRDLRFSDIDREFLIGFRAYMRDVCKNKESTQEKGLYQLKSVIKRAVVAGLMQPTDDPFNYYTIGTTKGSREKLDLEDILALESLEVEVGSPEDVARDVFLFAFYASGMRFGDVCSLRWESVRKDRLVYTMMKSQKPKSVKLKRRAREILAKYSARPHESPFVFPLLNPDLDYSDPFFLRKKVHSRTAWVNRRLKTLAQLAGIEINLTTHVARHSFADLARRKSNGNIDAVSKALGHSKIQTTQTYLRSFDQEAEDNLMDTVFD